jgi:type II secretory pathway pseudopilin PulG
MLNPRSWRCGPSMLRLLITVLIILAAARIAVPRYSRGRKLAREMRLLKTIASITGAQAEYQFQYGRYAQSLVELATANLIGDDLALSTKDGYHLAIMGCQAGYVIKADPLQADRSGRNIMFPVGCPEFGFTDPPPTQDPPIFAPAMVRTNWRLGHFEPRL